MGKALSNDPRDNESLTELLFSIVDIQASQSIILQRDCWMDAPGEKYVSIAFSSK